MLQYSNVFFLLPTDVPGDPRYTIADAVLDDAPRRRQYRKVLFVAPLYSRTVPIVAVVFILAIVIACEFPAPPGRPSNVIQLAPLMSRTTVAFAAAGATICTDETPLAGRNVTVFVPDAPGIVPLKTNGNPGSLALLYVDKNSKTSCPLHQASRDYQWQL